VFATLQNTCSVVKRSVSPGSQRVIFPWQLPPVVLNHLQTTAADCFGIGVGTANQ
jgi:hypothetical protein